MFHIGVDVGGTFTDLVAVDARGRSTFAKSPTTYPDQSKGVVDGLKALAGELGLTIEAMMGETARLVHGTTVATNALLESKGVKVGMLTTEGHRDIIEMREGLKDDRYNLRLPPPEPIVARNLRIEVRERMRADGTVGVALDEASLDRAIDRLIAADIRAVAVCFLHSYRNPAHERAVREALRKRMPDAYVSLSSEVFSQIDEFSRFSTTIVNSYIGPVLSHYLRQLEQRLAEVGYRGGILIIQSHGGVSSIEESCRLAAGCVLSGPAGGVAGSRHASRQLGIGNVIPFDMGGTSTDISLIVGHEATLSRGRKVGNHRVALSSLDIETLGAGGGSIVRVDAGGILHVGPESAGSTPGPACYGRGGRLPTVTDANMVLGYLDPEKPLAGDTRLDLAAAQRALDDVAGALGIERLALASAVQTVVNTKMAEGIRLVTVRRGVDPRNYALMSFGGAAGLHVTDVARQLGVSRVIVPAATSVLSAWGMLATDLKVLTSRSHLADASSLDRSEIAGILGELEREGEARLRKAFDGEMSATHSADMRYGEQIFDIPVSLDGIDWSREGAVEEMVERFHRQHEQLYTYALRDQPAVLINLHVASVGKLAEVPRDAVRATNARAASPSKRRIYLDGWTDVDVHSFGDLVSGQVLDGPALVESPLTAILLRGRDQATVTPDGWLDIAVHAAGEHKGADIPQ